MEIFAYMIEWFLVLIALACAIGLASLAYWVWKSDKNRDR